MGAESRACSRRVRLNGVAFVEQLLIVYILKEIPQCLDVAVVVGDVGIIHINPIPYSFRKRHPLLRVFHHFLAAGLVVLLNGNLRPDVLLGDSELLLHTELNRKPVRVPSGATSHTEPALRLVSADRVLDGARHDMMYARHPISGRRPLEKDELRSAFAQLQRLFKRMVFLPSLENLIRDSDRIQSPVFLEFHIIMSLFSSF